MSDHPPHFFRLASDQLAELSATFHNMDLFYQQELQRTRSTMGSETACNIQNDPRPSTSAPVPNSARQVQNAAPLLSLHHHEPNATSTASAKGKAPMEYRGDDDESDDSDGPWGNGYAIPIERIPTAPSTSLATSPPLLTLTSKTTFKSPLVLPRMVSTAPAPSTSQATVPVLSPPIPVSSPPILVLSPPITSSKVVVSPPPIASTSQTVLAPLNSTLTATPVPENEPTIYWYAVIRGTQTGVTNDPQEALNWVIDFEGATVFRYRKESMARNVYEMEEAAGYWRVNTVPDPSPYA
ncbi:hypothetical protein BDN72DRAFT_896413 [Pluteus cervinus]|uniref:Uncharacterized protein n=1 Tax=Pluteus cervinus TaxID=181527 RepID=A0ACD3AYR3_9AGAR|nr:hypothetical protein BDN72DRAFT_896413 [Pluteus cervinus]